MAEVFGSVLGLIVGSFLNVVIWRVPRGRSIVRPRSACPHCGHVLSSFDLLPVLSFIFLGGRCRYCRGSISWRYPLVEMLCGAVFMTLAIRYGLSVRFLGLAAYAGLLIAIAGIDIEHMIVPDVLSWPGLVLGVILSLFGQAQPSLLMALLGAAAGSGVLLAIYYACLILLKKEGLGLGDAKLMGMIGAFLGWQGALFAIALGSTLGALAGAAAIAAGKLRRSDPMPFGPFLGAAGLILAIWPWQEWLGPLLGL